MIEEQAPLLPLGHQEVLDFEPVRPTVLVADHCQHVTITDDTQLRLLRHVEQFARDIGEAHALLLTQHDGSEVLIVSQPEIPKQMTVGGHIRRSHIHQSRKGKGWLGGADTFHETLTDGRLHDPGEIMVAGGVCDNAVQIMHSPVVVF